MHPNADKNRRLIQQYPFLTEILEINLSPHAPDRARLNDLTIKVQVADGELMFRRPDNIGVDLYGIEQLDSYFHHTENKRRGQIGRRADHLFLVFNDGRTTLFDWLDFGDDRLLYPKMAFWRYADPSSHWRSGPMWGDVSYLVWVSIEAWYTDAENADRPNGHFGDFQDRSMTVTVYRKPKQGFERLDRASHETDFLRLNNHVFADRHLYDDRNIIAIGGRVEELCQLFVDDVWLNGLLEAYNQIELRGMSGRFDDTAVRIYGIAGRNIVTLEDGVCQITFMGDASHTSLNTSSMDGTLPQLRKLVKRVVEQWNHYPEWRSEVQPDKKVSIL